MLGLAAHVVTPAPTSKPSIESHGTQLTAQRFSKVAAIFVQFSPPKILQLSCLGSFIQNASMSDCVATLGVIARRAVWA